eukprot:1004152-Pyramimonas_sp.AAC.1
MVKSTRASPRRAPALSATRRRGHAGRNRGYESETRGVGARGGHGYYRGAYADPGDTEALSGATKRRPSQCSYPL